MESFGEAKQSKPQTVDDLMAEWYRYKKSPYSSGVVKDRVDKIKSDYDHNLHFFLKRGQEMIAHDNKIDSVASYLKSAKSRSLLFYYAFTEWLEEKRKQNSMEFSSEEIKYNGVEDCLEVIENSDRVEKALCLLENKNFNLDLSDNSQLKNNVIQIVDAVQLADSQTRDGFAKKLSGEFGEIFKDGEYVKEGEVWVLGQYHDFLEEFFQEYFFRLKITPAEFESLGQEIKRQLSWPKPFRDHLYEVLEGFAKSDQATDNKEETFAQQILQSAHWTEQDRGNFYLFQEFFSLTGGFLELESVDLERFTQVDPMTEMENARSEILPNLLKIQDNEDKIFACLEVIDIGMGDLVLAHLSELDFSENDEVDLMAYIAERDPALIYANLAHIPFMDFEQASLDRILDFLALNPDLFIYHYHQLPIADNREKEFVEKAIYAEPLTVLLNLLEQGHSSALFSKIPIDELFNYLENVIYGEKYQPAQIFNFLQGVKLSGEPKLIEFASDLKQRVLQDLAKPLVEDVEFTKMHQPDSEEDVIIQQAIKTLRAQGVTTGFRDILAFAMIRAGEDGAYFDESYLFTRAIRRGLKIKDSESLPDFDDDTRLSVLKEFETSKFAFLADDNWVIENNLDGVLFEPRTEKERQLMVDVILTTHRRKPKLLNYLQKNINLFSSEQADKYIRELIDGDVVGFLEFNDYSIIQNLDWGDELKEYAQKKVLQIKPSSLANYFSLFNLNNNRQQQELIKEYQEQGIVPFTHFADPSQAIAVLGQRMFHGIKWAESDDKLVNQVEKTVQIAQNISPSLRQLLTSIKCKNFTEEIERYSVDNLKLLDRFFSEEKELFDQMFLSKSGLKYDFSCFKYLQEKDFSKFVAGLMVLKDETYKEKQKKRVQAVSQKKVNFQTHGELLILSFSARNILVAMSVKLNLSLGEIIGAIAKSEIELSDPAEKVGLITDSFIQLVEVVGDVQKTFDFIEESKEQISKIYENLGDERGSYFLFRLLEFFWKLSPQDREAFSHLDLRKLASGYGYKEVFQHLTQLCDGNDESLIKFSQKEDLKIYKKFTSKFGLLEESEFLTEFYKVAQGEELSDYHRVLGIVDSGPKGIDQFVKAYEKIKDRIINNPEFDLTEAELDNPLLARFISVILHFDDSDWAQDINLVQYIKEIKKAQKEGKVGPLPDGYTQEILQVKKVDKSQQNQTGVSGGAVDRFCTLADSVETGVLLSVNNERVVDIASKIIQSILFRKNNLISDSENIEFNDELSSEKIAKMQLRINEQIVMLDGLIQQLQSATSRKNLLKILLKFESVNNISQENSYTSPYIRQLVFAIGQSKFPDHMAVGESLVYVSKPKKEEVEQLVEFMKNNLAQHIIPSLNLSEVEQKHLKKVLNTDALEQDLGRLNELLSDKTKKIQCIPNRSILAEFSGYYGDACWTSQSNIMQNNPNMVGITFVLNPETAKAKIIGSCLLIETTVNGEKVIIVRGLDPRQNEISKVSASSFVDEFLSYVEKICRARGIKKILIPFDETGATTNRPAIESVYEQMKEANDFEKVNLDEKIDFNSHDITNSCYVVREIK